MFRIGDEVFFKDQYNDLFRVAVLIQFEQDGKVTIRFSNGTVINTVIERIYNASDAINELNNTCFKQIKIAKNFKSATTSKEKYIHKIKDELRGLYSSVNLYKSQIVRLHLDLDKANQEINFQNNKLDNNVTNLNDKCMELISKHISYDECQTKIKLYELEEDIDCYNKEILANMNELGDLSRDIDFKNEKIKQLNTKIKIEELKYKSISNELSECEINCNNQKKLIDSSSIELDNIKSLLKEANLKISTLEVSMKNTSLTLFFIGTIIGGFVATVVSLNT